MKTRCWLNLNPIPLPGCSKASATYEKSQNGSKHSQALTRVLVLKRVLRDTCCLLGSNWPRTGPPWPTWVRGVHCNATDAGGVYSAAGVDNAYACVYEGVCVCGWGAGVVGEQQLWVYIKRE